MKAKLLGGLGLKGYLVTDGKNPINLFNTANGFIADNKWPITIEIIIPYIFMTINIISWCQYFYLEFLELLQFFQNIAGYYTSIAS